MIERWDLFRGRDFAMLAVFQSPAERLREFVATQEPEFDLVADPEMKLYETYDLESSWLGAMKPNVMAKAANAATAGIRLVGPVDGPPMRLPGDYLIDRAGVIQVAYRGKDIADHVPLEAADAFLTSQNA